MNIEHAFSDGVRCSTRMTRQNGIASSKLVQQSVVQREVATSRFLETTEVPAPRVFGLPATLEKRVGVAYLLTKKVPRQSYLH